MLCIGSSGLLIPESGPVGGTYLAHPLIGVHQVFIGNHPLAVPLLQRGHTLADGLFPLQGLPRGGAVPAVT